MSKINVGIVGARGYTGEELINVLLRHHEVNLSYLCASAKVDAALPISTVFPKFKNRTDAICHPLNIDALIKQCDVVFLALPHTVSMEIVPLLLNAKKRVIDLSADYRLNDSKVYERYYNVAHKDMGNVKRAVYGLPELYREKIKSAQLVANPGCYPTAAILGLAPLVSRDSIDLTSVIIDAKSGVTGAGRKIAQEFLFSEVNEDFLAYKVNIHQHAPEIDQELGKLANGKMSVTFVPHLLPVNRGILETLYVKCGTGKRSTKDIAALFERFYKKEPFVRIRKEGEFPKLKDVVGTNFCDIGVKGDGTTMIIIAVIDNLLKGAAGQAVQNMNIMYGFPETSAL